MLCTVYCLAAPNYHQFQLLELRHDQPYPIESYDLTSTRDDLWHRPLSDLLTEHAETLTDFLLRVMTRKVKLEKPKDVAWLLASYAREARSRAATHLLAAFDAVKSALQESLGVTFEGERGGHFFLSTLIQTLFYGIFSAWVLWRRTPDADVPHAVFDWRLSASYLRLPVLRALFHAITEPGALNTVQITEVLDRATDALNRVQPIFFDTFNDEDAINYFYEPFLEAFDPELRKQLGVWYTPREIVRYMVERVDHLLRTELHEPLGLASPNVQVLDPCCGTGAYLVEVLHRVEQTLREQAGDDSALIGADLRRAATTRIFGFEIMPAPFVIAHLQVANLLEKAGASLTVSQRAQVFLTSALTGWVPGRHPQSNFGFPAFTEERDAAEAVKQADTILVILGNPPYSGYAGIALGEERDLSEAYRNAVPNLPKPQGHGLNELYVRFFRIAERRITQNRGHRGIFSFISNYSWLDGLSHTTMRHNLLHSFNNIFIDNLHGDRKITEYAPDGHTSETVFAMQGTSVGIKVGTAISTFVKNGQPNEGPSLQYRDFEDARAAERRAHLLASSRREETYVSLEPNPILGLPFKPRTVTTSYLDWPRLPELFPVSFPGIKTSRDTLLVDIDRSTLEVRLQQYFDPAITDQTIGQSFPSAMLNSPRFDAVQTRRTLLRRGFRAWQILKYAYRPFDIRWIYWEPETKLLDEKRNEYVGLVPTPVPTLIAQQKTRATWRPSQNTQELACLDLMDRGATCFPIRALQSGGSMLHQDELYPNLSTGAENHLADLGVHDESLFYHALSTMHSPLYSSENYGALLSDWPRISIPATTELLIHSATLGRHLAALLDPESSIQFLAEWGFIALLHIPPEFTGGTSKENDGRNAARFALTAGWGAAGQGDTVMPRRGDARERKWTENEAARLTTVAAAQSLTLDDALELLGQRCVDVYLNGGAYWAAVPVNVWDYNLGGYQVLKKWLSYREEPLLGRPLSEEEVRYFATLPKSSGASRQFFFSARPSTPAMQQYSPVPAAWPHECVVLFSLR
jgi:hypothetical protein